MDPLTLVATRQTPQTERADDRQIPNAAGGYGFKLGDDARVHRFLTLGTTGGTYYTGERELTKANADVVIKAARERGAWLVDQVVAVSTAGRAPRQNPAVFALAAVAGLGDQDARRAAFTALPAVCRTGTHLFLFTKYVEQFRGWGRGLRRAVGSWFLDRDTDDLAYQVLKYRQREGWSMRDLLRLGRVTPDSAARDALFRWITQGTADAPVPDGLGYALYQDGDRVAQLPGLIQAFTAAQNTTDVAEWARLIEAHPLSWEMLPDAALTEPQVWRALVAKGMPQTALIRQLPRLTRLGVLDGDTLRTVTTQLADPTRLRKGRVHPVNLLVALRTYAAGQSARGQGEWTPKRQIIDALDAAFYQAFKTVEPAGKRTLLALDVSGSMGWTQSGLPITCREASAAMALVTMATEPATTCVGFTTGLSELSISPRQRLDDAIRAISNLPFGGTDCAAPMVWAEKTRQEFDTFVVMTDIETWAGTIHPHQALVRYREKTGIDARLVVAGFTATDVSIADPADAGMLDIAGLDSAVPNLIADFSRGTV